MNFNGSERPERDVILDVSRAERAAPIKSQPGIDTIRSMELSVLARNETCAGY